MSRSVGEGRVERGGGHVEVLVDRPVLVDRVLVAEHEEAHERLGVDLLTEIGAREDDRVGHLAGDVPLDGGVLDRRLESGQRGARIVRLGLEGRDLGLELGEPGLGVGQRLGCGLGPLAGGGDRFRVGHGRRGGDREHAGEQRADDNSPDDLDASPHNGAKP